MKLPEPLLEATLVRRYQRFLADVRLEDGTVTTVHCPNPGAMTGCAEPGSAVVLSRSANPARKLPLTWELVRSGRSWVGVNTARTNHVVREGLERGRVPELTGYRSLRAEVPHGTSSRLDFLLEDGDRRCWIEVKNVTLAERGVAMFPDAVTARGRKHLEALRRLVRRGDRAVVLFLVSRGDCREFRPAEHVDPALAAGLRRAVVGGVEILVRAARVRRDSITLARPMTALLD